MRLGQARAQAIASSGLRLGEWKVKELKFDHRSCKYNTDEQKKVCEKHRNCRKGGRRGNLPCTYENPYTDCHCVNELENERYCEQTCGPELQDIKVAETRKHPDFSKTDDGLYYNDIMMIKLARPAVYNLLVRPVCLTPPDFDNLLGEEGHTPTHYKDASVVGWGLTYKKDYQDTEQVAASVQQKLTTPLLSNKQCIQIFEEKLGGFVLDIAVDKQLCAGGEYGQSSCNGDSGGPLLGREQPTGPFSLIGVVSSGAGTCYDGSPQIYTRVSHYRDWILGQMV